MDAYVLRLRQQLGAVAPDVNYDHAIARDEHDCGCAYITQQERALGQQSVEWTLAHTDQASKDFMREQPFDLRCAVGDHAVHLVHGSPRTVDEYLERVAYDATPVADEVRRAGLPGEFADKLAT